MDCDVLVVGGGSAGVAAAVSSARCGARTVLVERTGMLGGMATTALVHSVCGLYLVNPESAAVMAHPGFPAEFAARLCAAGGAAAPIRMGRLDVLLHSPPAFAVVADETAAAQPGLRVLLHSEVVRIFCRGDLTRGAVAVCRGSSLTIRFAALVDASGDAVAALLSGAELAPAGAGRLQRPAYIFSIHGVEDTGADEQLRLQLAHAVATGVGAGALPREALGVAFRSNGQRGQLFATLDLEADWGGGYAPTDPVCLTRIEMTGRQVATAIWRHLQHIHPAFRTSWIGAFPARAGIRESRNIAGLYRLEAADIENGSEFEDRVALATWPMELRETAAGPKLRHARDNRPCDIPLRCLRSTNRTNLFAAGRIISASHQAQASIRVIGTCLATGQAAGTAAALTALGHPADAAAVRERIAWRELRQQAVA